MAQIEERPTETRTEVRLVVSVVLYHYPNYNPPHLRYYHYAQGDKSLCNKVRKCVEVDDEWVQRWELSECAQCGDNYPEPWYMDGAWDDG